MTLPLDGAAYERRDAMAFEMAERGDQPARDAILRIMQRDKSPEKRAQGGKAARKARCALNGRNLQRSALGW